jgi:predicted choloylglycine hydrolase
LAPTTRIHNGDKVQLLANKNLRYLELTGTPYQRGYAHGTQLKEEIKEVIQLFKEDIRKNTNEDPNAFISKFLKLTDFKSEIQKQTPHLLEELRGISEGSGIDMETIFMHQLGDEYWFNTNDIMAHHCSSFGVNKQGNQPSMTAQNMDIPTFYHGFQTVIKIIDPDSDMEMMMLTIPGHLGITGMNNKSVSINCNTLMQLNYGKTGLPVTFIVRGVVEKNTQKEALQFLDDIKHASGQNFIIGGPENVHSMECSANTIAEYRPFEKSKYTYHTNHPMANTDYSISYVEYLKKNNVTIEEGLNQCLRIRSFRQRFTDNNQNITLEDIKDVLRARDTESPDVVSNSHTYASVIYILSDTPKFIIAPGQPHKTDYIEIKL